jgi:hypothetical protein
VCFLFLENKKLTSSFPVKTVTGCLILYKDPIALRPQITPGLPFSIPHVVINNEPRNAFSYKKTAMQNKLLLGSWQFSIKVTDRIDDLTTTKPYSFAWRFPCSRRALFKLISN